MKTYETPEFEIVLFSAADVICTSTAEGGNMEIEEEEQV